MVIALVSKPGLTSASALSIPKDWDAAWFRGFINNLLKGGDVRNAVGVNGISVNGSIASPYATIGIGGIGATYPIILSPPAGTYALQIDGATFAAISMNASGATGFTSDFYIFQNTGAAGSGGSFIGTRSASSLNFQTNAITRYLISGVGQHTFSAPDAGQNQTVTINCLDNTNAVKFVDTSTGSGFNLSFSDSTATRGFIGFGPALFSGGAISDFGLSSSTGSFKIAVGSGATTVLTINSTQFAIAGQFACNGVTPAARTTGFGTPTGNTVVANFPGATATLLQTSQTVAEILALLKQTGIIGA